MRYMPGPVNVLIDLFIRDPLSSSDLAYHLHSSHKKKTLVARRLLICTHMPHTFTCTHTSLNILTGRRYKAV